MLPFRVWKEHVKPYLMSVELGPPIRCALVSLLTSCRGYHALWEEVVSSHELVITHDRNAIQFYGRVSLSDFQAYISAALRATVLHPFRLAFQDLVRIPQLNILHQLVPNIASQSFASITIAANFSFDHKDITYYLHGVHMGIPIVYSTAHWIYATCDGIEVRLMDLRLAIADFNDEGVHALAASSPVEYTEPMEFPTTRFANAKKVARISSLFLGLPGDANNKRSSIAVEWSEDIWQPHVVDLSLCGDACIGAAISKADQDGTDIVVSALLQVHIAMQDNDTTWLPITSLRLSHEPVPGYYCS